MRLTHLILHEAAFQTGSLSLLTASETRQHIYQRYEGGAIRIARLWRSDAWVAGFHFDKRRHTDERVSDSFSMPVFECWVLCSLSCERGEDNGWAGG
jgi:hypothetical protein